MLFWLEYELDEEHINHGTGTDAQQSAALPYMKPGNDSTADGLRNSERCTDKGHILQAVHHQHTHDGKRQHLSQIGDDRGRFPVFSKDQEGEETKSGGHQSADGNGQNGMGVIHGWPPFRSSLP